MEQSTESSDDEISVDEICRMVGLRKPRIRNQSEKRIDIQALNFGFMDSEGNIVDLNATNSTDHDENFVEKSDIITVSEENRVNTTTETAAVETTEIQIDQEKITSCDNISLEEHNNYKPGAKSTECENIIEETDLVTSSDEHFVDTTGSAAIQIVNCSNNQGDGNSSNEDEPGNANQSSEEGFGDISARQSSEEDFGDISARRKRKSKNLADKTQWKIPKNKKLRMEGKEYLGHRREKKNNANWKGVHDTPREARKMGPPCTSSFCEKSKLRTCILISEEERSNMFEMFWKMTWPQKRQYILTLLETHPKKQVKKKENSRRTNDTRSYFLLTGRGRMQVCHKLFLSTFGIKDWTIRYWMEKSNIHRMIPDVTHVQPEDSHKKVEHIYLKEFFRSLPKMPSHYCRQSSSRLYLEPIISTKSKLYELYCNKCTENGKNALSRWAFDKTFNEENLSMFHPKKDECDTCCAHKVGNLPKEVWDLHIQRKDEARREKEADKILAQSNQVHVFTQDVQAVKLCPQLNASALYFKTKLCLHNFTMYNIGTKDVTCFWFDESNGGLVSSVYTSCIIHKLKPVLNVKHAPVILYSDGCTAQNRNAVLANALLDLAVEKGIVIMQKFLEKGHTQMECDSVHSAIESKVTGKEIYLPSQYITYTKEARVKKPYEAVYLSYDFFNDYSAETTMRYKSIRPGNRPNDPTVTDLRVLQYNPNGIIRYKLKFSDELQELPRRAQSKKDHTIKKLYQERLKISANKWKDLQELKAVIPPDCHHFYDLLPH